MKTALIALAFAAACSAASAQALDLRPVDRGPVLASPVPVAAPAGVAPKPMPDLANPLDPLAPTVLQSKTLDSAVFAKTAVSKSFTRRDDVSGSFGFLCGLKPSAAGAGAASAYGVDPHGRFVGAKLSVAF